MRITYISHATLLIETAGLKIVTDPWVQGSSYCGQWYLFPKALSPEKIRNADVVVYSHGHEDHLHAESLATVNKKSKIFYPYSWYGGTSEFFNELGFENVKEVMNEETVKVGDVSITYLANNLDNVMVIEDGETVLININDALPSASVAMIEGMLNKIRSRWKKIDYVFCSYGGASYFPNTVHFSKKNDLEIGETREMFFINNFCKIIDGLKPRFAVPFATDFVLLDDWQRWINEIKFPRTKIESFFREYTKGKSPTKILEAYPDDVIKDGSFIERSPYHKKIASKPLLDSIDEDYKEEIRAKKNIPLLSATELGALMEQVREHIVKKQYIIPDVIRKKIVFTIRIIDAEGQNCLNIDFRSGKPEFTEDSKVPKQSLLAISLRSRTIKYAIENEWGGDAIIIGYGAEVQIMDKEALRWEMENYCVRLLSRYPNTKEYLRKTPLRALRYLLSDDTKRKNLLQRILRRPGKIVDYTDKRLLDRDLWLNKDKCEVCKACNI
jgi:hypothetical protein